ncbi:GNAT family N-acetyltransferase [Streptomyces sp. AV19]|uniref:GNAT family N-acetyltransferase n=1 Tax=Streptomyces sp. AV19 TaxID=2793068 RepID=UPI0018FE2539|nr:GNAT family protein [Streptomyces sp. AV19]MBH1937414.1 GNAT family N-acetyltransferase [Streptomyces sp. AV19]MDG4533813.1 GNAT family N-acetyltransferase [Streptomyces sp. AV19]
MLSSSLAPGADLCPLEPWQAEEFAAYVAAHQEHLAPWLPWATDVTNTDGARAFLQRYADAQRDDRGRLFAIRLDGALVGGTLFRVFDVRSGVCELGVWISPEAQGRGLVTAAARKMIDWAFGARGMARVEWRASVDNHRSAAVAKRLGMTHEGVLRQSFPVDGVRQDMAVWSLLATEWAA